MGTCRTLVCIGLLLGCLAVGPAFAEEDVPEWKPHEVARVQGKSVTWDDLCRAAVEHLIPALRVPESTASSILERVVSERVIASACRARGIEATAESITARRAQLDDDVKKRTGGRQSLDDILTAQVVSAGALASRLAADLHGRALAGAGVDAAELVRKAQVLVYAPNAAYPSAKAAADDAFLIVDGERVTVPIFGGRLLANVGAGRVRAILDAECRSRLAVQTGARLSEEAMAAEVVRLANLQFLERRFDPEDVWETVFLHQGREERHDRTQEELPSSPHARSLFGLVKKYREAASTDDVRREWESKRDSVYGPHVSVTDIRITFRGAADVFGGGAKRTRTEALRLARSYLAELGALHAPPFGELARRIQREADPDVTAEDLYIYQTDRNRILLDHALRLRDGEVGPLFETLSEVHFLQRHAALPAPRFETIEPLVRERLARERVRNWLEDTMNDPATVRLRWPLPLMP